MSTFTLPGTDVSVKLVNDLFEKELLEFPAFKNWIKTLHEFYKSPYVLRAIHIQAIDRFRGRLGFIKLAATITNPEGESLPGAVFLRGASVGMMMLLQPDDLPQGSQDEKYVLLTVQPRVPAGGLQFVELPAGMVDGGTFRGMAAAEIKDELDLEIPEDRLINLTELAIPEKEVEKPGETTPRAMFPSAGGYDEYIQIFLYVMTVPRAQLEEWMGKLTGLRDKGEKITLKLVKLEELWREGARDAKALAALALYEGLKRAGKL